MGDQLLKETAEIIKSASPKNSFSARWGGDEFIILLPKTNFIEAGELANSMTELASKAQIGSLQLSISIGWETKNDVEESIKDVFKKAEDYMYRRKLFESPSMRGKTIKAILHTLHEKNKREEQHSKRVAKLCKLLGQELNLNDKEVAELEICGLFHDIGKIAINESILNKPAKLTDEEWTEMKRHSEIGYRILSAVNDMAEIANYVLAHHERWDGLGYPKGLKGEEIPVQARIIALVDSYDAMTSDREYRKALSDEYAIGEIERNAGIQFDPELARKFVQILANQGNTETK